VVVEMGGGGDATGVGADAACSADDGLTVEFETGLIDMESPGAGW
jgi:hypothetical protein